MITKTCLHKGEFHPVFCEDFHFHTSLKKDLYLAAVMDGCSMGRDSHFASSLIAKILKKISKEMGYQDFAKDLPPLESWKLKDLAKEIIRRIHQELKEISSKLYLDELELLSTLNLGLINTHKAEAWVLIIGDGFVATQDKIITIDQDNRPNYMAYHLGEDFETWYEGEKNYFHFQDIHELSLASDGIASFEKLDKSGDDFKGATEDFLLLDDSFSDIGNSFDKKIRFLKESYGLIATDDISIIQMKW